jgi:mannitol/fructose-specific phosphotransferase system IIA component (Ntr-type)
MKILDILSRQAVKVPLDSSEKKAAIFELIDLLAGCALITNAATLKEVVWDREQQRSTGIGEGLAIPHGRSDVSRNLAMAIGKPAEPIEFNAMDKRPVRLIVLLTSPPDRTADHIQALGKISRLMADPKFRTAAYDAVSADELYELFNNAET